jgi:hypothetical protein
MRSFKFKKNEFSILVLANLAYLGQWSPRCDYRSKPMQSCRCKLITAASPCNLVAVNLCVVPTPAIGLQ